MRHYAIALFALATPLIGGEAPRILFPHDGARPYSSYVLLHGSALPLTELELLSGATVVATTRADADGSWETVAHVGPGPHQLRVRDRQNHSLESPTIRTENQGHFDPPRTAFKIAGLRSADVILNRLDGSYFNRLFASVYAHAALLAGADREGTPLVLEAAEDGDGFGEVRVVPIESASFYRDATAVAFFRATAPLTRNQREAVVDWGRKIATPEARFWSPQAEFGAFYVAWLLWDFKRDQPSDPARFQQALNSIENSVKSTSRFTCSTLVWRAFWEGTGHQVDLSTPNRAEFADNFDELATPELVRRLKPFLIVPDTLRLGGKLTPLP